MDVKADLLGSITKNYDQMIENLSTIISNFSFSKTFTDKSSKQILIKCMFSNPQIEEPTQDSIYYLQQRQKDYVFKIKFDIEYQFILQHERVIKIPVKNKFYVIVPILTGTKYDTYISKKYSKNELWNKGLDLNQLSADLILSGIPYFVQNIYSYPTNKPTIVPNDKDNLIAVAQFMKQDDPIFGNSYYSRIGIWKAKTGEETFVLLFKQFDARFKEAIIPMKWLLYLFGAKNDKEILSFFQNDKYFTNYLIETFRVNPKLYLGESYNEQDNQFSNRLKNIKELILELIRKNQSVDEEDLDQAMEKYLGPYSIKTLYQFVEMMKTLWYANKFNAYTDRDDLKNKRVQTMGIQFVGQLRSCLNQAWSVHIRMITQQLKQVEFLQIPNFESLIIEESEKMAETLGQNIIKSISSATDENLTPLQKSLNEQKSRLQDIMQKREIVLRLDSMGGKISYDQRKVQQSQYGFLCAMTTNEYQCGRYISPTIHCEFTNAVDPKLYKEYLKKYKNLVQVDLSANKSSQKSFYIPVKINYIIEGFIEYTKAKQLYFDLMEFRQKNEELRTTSVYFQIENEMRNPIAEVGILTDIGRMIIPIYRTKTVPKSYYISSKKESSQSSDKLCLSLGPLCGQNFLTENEIDKLFQNGNLLYICPEMAQNFIINEWPDITATNNEFQEYYKTKDYYYFTLPFDLTGIVPSLNPLVQMMKGVRQSYSSGQMKHNISSMYTNFMNQFNVNLFILQRPQLNPVHSIMEWTYQDFAEHPAQQLLYISFKPDTFNQEDAIIGSQGYFLRGGSQNIQYITYTTYLENSSQKFPIQKLPKFGSKVSFKQTLIHKTETDILNNVRNMFVKFNFSEGVVSNIRLNDKQGNKIPGETINETNIDSCYEIMIRIQIHRTASQGDKFVSRNCQKGTIGKINKEYDIDLFQNGFVSNFIFSTYNAVMKRETYGQIAEPCLNRYACDNEIYNIPISIYQKQYDYLDKISYIEPQICISSQTGQKLFQSSILAGPISYGSQMLLVDLKLYARDLGPIAKQTRHATKGRKRAGGLSLGNLEQTCFNAAGAFNYLKDANNTNTIWYICPICGQSITTYKKYNPDTNTMQYFCQLCGEQKELIEMGNNFMEVSFLQTLYGSGINVVFDGKKMKLSRR